LASVWFFLPFLAMLQLLLLASMAVTDQNHHHRRM